MTDTTLTIDTGFPPIIGESPRALILGSMPGVQSLVQQQYYAHPRNTFWPIMASLFNFDVNLAYTERCHLLTQSGVAVWDVLQSGHRPGSLDTNIENDTMVLNDFTTLFQQYSTISAIYFNGAKAETVFRQALPLLTEVQRSSLTLQRLPSSSPAHAAQSFEQKLACWRATFFAITI
jgi:TDG/mug DNA glycosylase family protein